MPEDASPRIGVRRSVTQEERARGDDDGVLRSGRHGYRRWQVDVLLARAVRHGSDARQEIVGREVSQFDSCGAGALEIEVEPGDVVEARRERLAVAERVDLSIGQGLLLVRDSVRTRGRDRRGRCF